MKKRDRSLNPLQKCGPISHNEDHLQVLTPKVIDHGFINKVFDRSLKPPCRCGPISHNEDHLQVLTPNVIDHGSINKVFNRSLKPLCRCVIQSKGLVIDRNFGYKKM